MAEERENIGTLEEASIKAKESYKNFIQSVSAFINLAEYYSDSTHIGSLLEDNFASKHAISVSKLLKEDEKEIATDIAFYAIIPLEDVNEMKNDIKRYLNIEEEDKKADEWEKTDDLLFLADSFQYYKENIDRYSASIIENRRVENYINDPLYDPNSIVKI